MDELEARIRACDGLNSAEVARLFNEFVDQYADAEFRPIDAPVFWRAVAHIGHCLSSSSTDILNYFTLSEAWSIYVRTMRTEGRAFRFCLQNMDTVADEERVFRHALMAMLAIVFGQGDVDDRVGECLTIAYSSVKVRNELTG